MSVQDTGVVDFVAHDSGEDSVLLVMVEAREWGDSGRQLLELQEKFNTYYAYAAQGKLVADYPELAGKRIAFELRCAEPPSERELEFLKIVVAKHLEPAGISFAWKVIGRPPVPR